MPGILCMHLAACVYFIGETKPATAAFRKDCDDPHLRVLVIEMIHLCSAKLVCNDGTTDGREDGWGGGRRDGRMDVDKDGRGGPEVGSVPSIWRIAGSIPTRANT